MKIKYAIPTLVLLCVIAFNSLDAQKRWWAGSLSGKGPVVEQLLELNTFERISLAISADVYLSYGEAQSIRVRGQENIIENLLTEIQDKTWRIRFDRPIRRSQGLKIFITLPYLSGARVSGSGNVESQHTWQTTSFYAGVSGSGNINLLLQTEELSSKVSGSGNIMLGGNAKEYTVQITGSGNVKAYELAAEHCKVKISGSGDARVDAQEQLDVRISGSGDVMYTGRPRVNSKISGSGSLRSK
ncbi:MAG: DUF2807 domain-containing protein [Saprospiraceae bacterium]|nr:DUF2807 domain-containing protein [Saprospiraceae bacterium]